MSDFLIDLVSAASKEFKTFQEANKEFFLYKLNNKSFVFSYCQYTVKYSFSKIKSGISMAIYWEDLRVKSVKIKPENINADFFQQVADKILIPYIRKGKIGEIEEKKEEEEKALPENMPENAKKCFKILQFKKKEYSDHVEILEKKIEDFVLDPAKYDHEFKTHINETYEDEQTIIIMGHSFSAAEVLEKCAPEEFEREFESFLEGLDKNNDSSYKILKEEKEFLESELEFVIERLDIYREQYNV